MDADRFLRSTRLSSACPTTSPLASSTAAKTRLVASAPSASARCASSCASVNGYSNAVPAHRTKKSGPPELTQSRRRGMSSW